MAAARACRPGCSSLIREGQPCPTHKRIPWEGRGSRHERGYGNDWDRRRLRILQRDRYRCQYCPKSASTVDHKTPKAEGGTDDDSNLVACCWDCQKRKAGQEGARGRMRHRRAGAR